MGLDFPLPFGPVQPGINQGSSLFSAAVLSACMRLGVDEGDSGEQSFPLTGDAVHQ
jgi:hypothetical protein